MSKHTATAIAVVALVGSTNLGKIIFSIYFMF